MNVKELIEKLSELDPYMDVKINSCTGGLMYVHDVEVRREYSEYDQDFDNYVLVIQ